MSAMLFSRYHHIFEIFHELSMFYSSVLTHIGHWEMGKSRSLSGCASQEAVEKLTGVTLPKGGPGYSLTSAGCGWAPESDAHEWVPVLLPTDWCEALGKPLPLSGSASVKLGNLLCEAEQLWKLNRVMHLTSTFSSLGLKREAEPFWPTLNRGLVLGLAVIAVAEKEKMYAMAWLSPS